MTDLWSRFRWHIITALLALLSAMSATIAVLAIGGISWQKAWPWALLVASVLLALVALAVQSYAPPGPNFVERALAVQIEPVLIISGAGLTLLGTLFWFDLDSRGPKDPSNWWLAPIAIGLLLLTVGVIRIVSPAEEVDDPTIQTIRSLAARAGHANEEAEALRKAASELDPAPSDATRETIEQVVAKVTVENEAVKEHLAEAEDLYRQLIELKAKAEDRALNAECDYGVAKNRFDTARRRAHADRQPTDSHPPRERATSRRGADS